MRQKGNYKRKKEGWKFKMAICEIPASACDFGANNKFFKVKKKSPVPILPPEQRGDLEESPNKANITLSLYTS